MAGDIKARVLRDAEKYVLQGKPAQAITEYLKIIKSDPNDVLTLNTIGDLYLRQGKVADARRFFSQVAEHYARNNFLLKAIAVYKKILSAEPENLEVNLTLASLYVKQGLTVEARNQFIRVAELFANAGRARESLDSYEKVVELDPMNSPVQLKLAEIYMADGAKERAHSSYAGAARAQAKAGDLQGAVGSFKRAAQLNPVNLDVMKGFLDASLQLGDVSAVLEQLKKSLIVAPDNVSMREMLGRAFLAAGDPENAAKVFQAVVAQDESHYLDMLGVSRAFLEAGDPDQAAGCLDSIVPILISRRETQRGVEACNLILKSHPRHILTLTRLASIHSATNNHPRYVETLEKVAGYYLSQQSPAEALEYLQKILQVEPDNEKYVTMHRQAFTEAFPGMPYRSPVTHEARSDAIDIDMPMVALGEPGRTEEPSPRGFVEIDLLLTYGMADKALEHLRALETEDPWNKEVRRRLLSLYKETRQHGKAAEQCLMLAALYCKDGDDSSAQKSLAEARKLAPELVSPGFDLDAFAQRHGIIIERASARPEPAVGRLPGVEVDLSGDLSEMFFQEAPETQAADETEVNQTRASEMAADEYTQGSTLVVPSESVEEKLQEVDFYIRLGFHDEARAKLEEIAKDHPHNPELPLRFRLLPATGDRATPDPATAAAVARNSETPVETTPPDAGDVFQELRIEQAVGRVVEDYSSESRARQRVAAKAESDSGVVPQIPILQPAETETEPASRAAVSGETQINTMFADLIDEVNSMTDQEIAREDFETHFNLGIAYREMDLLEEAIKEFQDAVKAVDPGKFPKEVVQCCGMLSTCFLDKGMPRSAIRWCQTGLNVPEISSHEVMALRYDMGAAYSATGETERALECFGVIFGNDPSYRDVAQKIDHLRGAPERHGP